MPTPIIACPSCKKAFTFRPEFAGKKVKCPKCSTPFLMTLPTPPAAPTKSATSPSPEPALPDPESEYDVTPEAPRPKTAPAPRFFNKPLTTNVKPSNAQVNKALLKSTALAAARNGPVGLVAGILVGGVYLLFRHNPNLAAGTAKAARFSFRLLFYGFAALVFAIFLLTITLHYVGPTIASWMRPTSSAHHAPPPPPGFASPTRTPPTYESLVAHYGADHVARMTVLNATKPDTDSLRIRGPIGFYGPDSFSISPNGDHLDCIFAYPMPFDILLQTIHFGTVTASDPQQRTLTVTLPQQ